MQILLPGSLTLEPILLPYKGLFFMCFSSGFSLRSFPHEMSCELGFSCGVAPALRLGPHSLGLWPRTKAAWIRGEKNVTLLNHSHHGIHGAYPTKIKSQPVIHHQPKRCLQFLIPVIEDMCYSANSPDGKWLMVLPSEAWQMRGKRRVGEKRRLSIFIFLC